VQILNRFQETVFQARFQDRAPALRFARMIGANPRRFALIGVRHQDGAWTVRYRARRQSPWLPDARATWTNNGGAR